MVSVFPLFVGLTWTNPASTVPSCCNPRFLRILTPSPSRNRTAWTLPLPPSSCPMASTCRGERDGLMGTGESLGLVLFIWRKDDGYCFGKTVWWPVYLFFRPDILFLWNLECNTLIGFCPFCWFRVGRRGCSHDRVEGRKLEFCAWGLSLFMAEPPFAEFITSRFD